MKKSVLALLAALSFVSCSREDSKSPENRHSITGVWLIEKEVVLNGKDNSIIREEIPKKDCEDKSNIQFTQEGKYFYENFTSYSGACESSNGNGYYTYDTKTKKLTVKLDGIKETEESEVTFINADQIAIIYTDGDYNGDGTIDKLVKYRYRKK